jgi:CBS domain-containing protein
MEPGLDVHGAETGGSARVLDGSPGPYRDILRVADIMSKDVVTATLSDTIFSVAQKMSELRVSCVIVTNQEQVVGILTEKDMLNSVALRDIEFRRLKVAERMSSPVDTIRADVSVFEADRLMDTLCIRRLPVLENERLVGIVTQTDITRGLISLNSLRYVSDIMSRQIASVPGDATVVDAARLMSTSNISCLVVMHRQEVAGILTEKDLLKRVVALHRDPTQTRVADVMSCPVVSVPSSWSILSASKKMETLHFHRLLVMDDKTVCGIITQTDIMRAIRSAFDAVESQRRAMEAELSDVVQRVILDMQRMRGVLQDLPGSSAQDGATAHATAPAAESLVSGPTSFL